MDSWRRGYGKRTAAVRAGKKKTLERARGGFDRASDACRTAPSETARQHRPRRIIAGQSGPGVARDLRALPAEPRAREEKTAAGLLARYLSRFRRAERPGSFANLAASSSKAQAINSACFTRACRFARACCVRRLRIRARSDLISSEATFGRPMPVCAANLDDRREAAAGLVGSRWAGRGAGGRKPTIKSSRFGVKGRHRAGFYAKPPRRRYRRGREDRGDSYAGREPSWPSSISSPERWPLGCGRPRRAWGIEPCVVPAKCQSKATSARAGRIASLHPGSSPSPHGQRSEYRCSNAACRMGPWRSAVVCIWRSWRRRPSAS